MTGVLQWRRWTGSAKLRELLIDSATLEAVAPLRVTTESVLVRDNESVGADLDGGCVLLSVRAGAYFSFNPVATEIWHTLAEPRRVDQILASLVEHHDVDMETVIRDVTPFLQTLVKHRLVRMIGPGDAP
jgi:hypothetical protein